MKTIRTALAAKTSPVALPTAPIAGVLSTMTAFVALLVLAF